MKNLREFEEKNYSEGFPRENSNSESTEFEITSHNDDDQYYSSDGSDQNDDSYYNQEDSNWEEDPNDDEPYNPEESWDSSDDEEEEEGYEDPKPSISGNPRILNFEDYFNRD